MPFRMFLANPLVLAVVTAVAIGVITYQIINKQKKKHAISRYPSYPDDGSLGPDHGYWKTSKPDNGYSEKENNTSTICRERCVSKRHDDSVGDSSNGPKGQKKTDDGHMRQNFINNPRDESKPGYDNTQKRNNAPSNYAEWHENLLSSYKENIDENTEEKSDKITNVVENINQKDIKMPDFVRNIDYEDSDSSESNSVNSVETNVTSASTEGAQCLNADIQGSNWVSLMKSKYSLDTSLDTEEEIYKRAVRDHLKIYVESKNNSYDKNFDNESTDYVGNNFSDSSDNTINSTAVSKTPIMCKGCEEARPNAVAYPCEHCYLCLDCAVKVHRIYKKCSICNSVIKTYELLKV